ncbi:MAG: RNA polymerase subunit sigma-70 [Burkholderiales bacterium]
MNNDSTPPATRHGQGDFATLVAPHRRVLAAHCYRMLGSWTEAEDALQDALSRAWQAHPRFEGRAAIETWLYRIATNACLTTLQKRPRRSVPELMGSAVRADEGMAHALEEARWIEPFPDRVLEVPDIESATIKRESVALAFVVALQHLPPRQRAVLLLRDVVGYDATEVAAMLAISIAAANSALARARATLAQTRRLNVAPAINMLNADQALLLNRYVAAWETRDVDSLVALLAEEATFSMPPFPTWFEGRSAITEVLRGRIFARERRFRLLPIIASGQPAFAVYKMENGAARYAPHGIQLIWLDARSIASVITFLKPRLVTAFGLPTELALPG